MTYPTEAHPLAQAFLEKARAAQEGGNEQMLEPARFRDLLDARALNNGLPVTPVASVVDVIARWDGREIPVRVYYPDISQPVAFSLYFHGGGFMVGNLETHDKICRFLASRAKVAIVAVDFRLSPEHVFPAAHDDCLAACLWILRHAEQHGLDARRFALAGESSGGHLALSTAYRLIEGNHPLPRTQLLLYPLVEMSTDSPAYRQFGSGYLLTEQRMRFYLDSYLAGADITDERLSLLRSPFLGRSSPTYVMTAGLDPTLSHAQMLVERLRQDGVAVTYDHFQGWPHGFLFWGHEAGAIKALEKASDALAAGLA
ncbi:alpha/beta hydrolase (plasmid) [Cupriavidus necator]|nr:alpha/beta hydrolase [Cupriavidus necator]QQX89551.1 alpha/beta hydrolase [Cupriavidus necator]